MPVSPMKFNRLIGKFLSEVNQVQQDHTNEKIDTPAAHAAVDVLLAELRAELDETPGA